MEFFRSNLGHLSSGERSERGKEESERRLFNQVIYFLITFICYRPSLKRCASRWDQEAPNKYQKNEEDPSTESKEGFHSSLTDVLQPNSLHTEQRERKDANLGLEDRSKSDQHLTKKEDKTRQAEKKIFLIVVN